MNLRHILLHNQILKFSLGNVFWHEWSQELFRNKFKYKLEALRERKPPWPRQIITPILPTVKMLCLGGERLPPPPPPHSSNKKNQQKFWIITCTMIWVSHHYYGVFCSFTHLRIPRSPPKFNQFFIVLPRTPP